MISLLSVFFILTSIMSFCVKTHPDFRVPVIRNVTVQDRYHNATYWTLDKSQTQPLVLEQYLFIKPHHSYSKTQNMEPIFLH